MLHQIDIARALAGHLTSENPLLASQNVYTDSAKSATKLHLKMRPAGIKMSRELEDGDHVIFPSLDRGFRDIRDMVNTVAEWTKRGVHVHFATEGVSMDDPAGRMMATVAALFAQYEAELISDRNREARAQLVAKGRYVGGREPPFWMVYKVGQPKELILNRKKIVAFRLIKQYRYLGFTLDEALARCEALYAKRENRRPISIHGDFVPKCRTPKGVKRDRKGRVFPLWHSVNYYQVGDEYIKALNDWRKFAAEKRVLREHRVDPVEVARRNHRGWEQNGVTEFVGTPPSPERYAEMAAEKHQEALERHARKERERFEGQIMGEGI